MGFASSQPRCLLQSLIAGSPVTRPAIAPHPPVQANYSRGVARDFASPSVGLLLVQPHLGLKDAVFRVKNVHEGDSRRPMTRLHNPLPIPHARNLVSSPHFPRSRIIPRSTVRANYNRGITPSSVVAGVGYIVGCADSTTSQFCPVLNESAAPTNRPSAPIGNVSQYQRWSSDDSAAFKSG